MRKMAINDFFATLLEKNYNTLNNFSLFTVFANRSQVGFFTVSQNNSWMKTFQVTEKHFWKHASWSKPNNEGTGTCLKNIETGKFSTDNKSGLLIERIWLISIAQKILNYSMP